jgi:LysM repeat protein
MAAVCGVLFLICFIMGAGLIQSEGRISKLEKNFALVSLDSEKKLDNNKNNYNKDINKNNYDKNIESDDKEVFFQTSPKIIKEIESENKNKNKDKDKEKNKKDEIDFDESLVNDKEEKINNRDKEILEIPDTYIVKDGDSLSKISKRIYGNINKVNKILEENNMENADKIYIGMILKIPNDVENKKIN